MIPRALVNHEHESKTFGKRWLSFFYNYNGLGYMFGFLVKNLSKKIFLARIMRATTWLCLAGSHVVALSRDDPYLKRWMKGREFQMNVQASKESKGVNFREI